MTYRRLDPLEKNIFLLQRYMIVCRTEWFSNGKKNHFECYNKKLIGDVISVVKCRVLSKYINKKRYDT